MPACLPFASNISVPKMLKVVPLEPGTFNCDELGEQRLAGVHGSLPGKCPEDCPNLAIAVQIDITLHRSKIRVNHGFQGFDPSFNRTAVWRNIEKGMIYLAQ